MAEIKEFIDPKAEKQIEDYLKSLQGIATSYNSIFNAAVQVDAQLTKTNKSQADSATKQVAANKAAQDATKIAKDLAAASASLDKQRQAALAVMAKQEDQERRYTAAMTMEVKTINDMVLQNKALRQARNDVDTSTKTGIKNLEELNQKINANSQAIKKNTDDASKQAMNIGNYGSAFKKLGGLIAGALSVTALFSFGKASVEAAAEAAKANRNLLFSVNGNKEAYNQLIEQANKLRDATGIDDEAIKQIQQLGAGAGYSTDRIMKLTTASVELSKKTGIDLQAAYMQLNMTLSGSVGRLARVDPEFKTLTETQLKNGAAIDLVNSKYGGFAANAAGSVSKAKIAWLEFQKAAGAALLPAVNSLLQLGTRTLQAIIPTETLSKTMEQEKLQVNSLAMALIGNSGNLETRRTLLIKLNALAPEVAKGLSAENINVSLLTRSLAEYNKQALNKILLQVRGEEIAKQQAEADRLGRVAIENTDKALKAADRSYGMLVSKGGLAKQAAIDAKAMYMARGDVGLYAESLQKAADASGDYMSGFSSGEYNLAKSVKGTTEYFNNQNSAITKNQTELDKLAKKFGINLNPSTTPTAPASTPVDKASTKAASDSLKAKQDAIKKENEATIKGYETDLKLFDANNETQITGETKLTNDLIDQEQYRQDQRFIIADDIIRKKVSSGIITEKDGEAERQVFMNASQKVIDDLKIRKAKETSDRIIAIEKERVDYAKAMAQEEQAFIGRMYDARLNALKRALMTGEITENEYNKRVSDAQFDANKASLKATISTLEAQWLATEWETAEELALWTKIQEAKQKLENETTDNALSNEEKRRQALLDTMDKVGQIGDALFGAQKDSYQNETDALAIEKEKQLALVGDNKVAQDAINKKFAIEEAVIARKKAQTDKEQALFDIAIQTAKNVVSSWKGGPVLMALAFALGAVQAAVIMARPLPEIPAYAKGTKSAPRGIAIIGEAGRELVLKNGNAQMISEPSMLNLQGGEQILNNKETERFLQSSNRGYDSASLKQSIEMGNARIELSNAKIVTAINNKSELHISATGDRITERKGNYFKTYFNRKISWVGKRN